MTLKIKKAEDRLDYARCVQMRTIVFTVGQNVPPAREVDEFENLAHHYIALQDGVPAGTVRWHIYGPGVAKIERLAVLEQFRGRKIGAELMAYVIEEISQRSGVREIRLGSQDHAIPFYEALGFRIHGDGYDDGGGIPHHDMVRPVE